MDEIRNDEARPSQSASPTLRSDLVGEKLDVAISAAFRKLVHTLSYHVPGTGWTSKDLAFLHKSLRKKERTLFGKDKWKTEAENLFRWDPSDYVTYGRFFGFGEYLRKYIREPYDKKCRIQKRHFQRARIVLQEISVISFEDFEYFNCTADDIDNDRALWPNFIDRIWNRIAASLPAEGLPQEAYSVGPDGTTARIGNTSQRYKSFDCGPERLSHRLLKVIKLPDVEALLLNAGHCYEWSIAFRDACAVLTKEKKYEIAQLFYRTIAAHWQEADLRSRHIAIMAAGTLTYVGEYISGLKEIEIWNNRIEAIFDNLPPEMVLVAEPLSYISSMHGRHGAYRKNFSGMTSEDPAYRRADFAERLLYCSGGQHMLPIGTKIVNVSKNVADHLHNRRQFLHLLSHDVGRVIEAYRSLRNDPQHADIAQFIKEATLKSLADFDISLSERGRIEDMMERRRP